jgi:hypothetical protein
MENDGEERGKEENGLEGRFVECRNSFHGVVGWIHGTDGISGWESWEDQ